MGRCQDQYGRGCCAPLDPASAGEARPEKLRRGDAVGVVDDEREGATTPGGARPLAPLPRRVGGAADGAATRQLLAVVSARAGWRGARLPAADAEGSGERI